MFRRRSRRPRPAPGHRTARVPEPEPSLEECPWCYGYGSVACTWCRETGDYDRDNEVDRDCRYCQGWGAMTCSACGGSGVR